MASYKIDNDGKRHKLVSVYIPEDLYLEGKKRKINFTEVITNHLREELGIPEAETNV